MPTKQTGQVAHAERGHAPWSPSATKRWLACPSSVPLTEELAHELPDSDSYHTVRGTLIHECAERYLMSGEEVTPPFNPLLSGETKSGEKVVIHYEEWLPIVQAYVEGVRDIVAAEAIMYGEENVYLLVEEPVTLPVADVWGTLDVAVISPGAIHVVDLKAGSGDLVFATSPQFRTYLCGVVSKHGARERMFTHVAQLANYNIENGWDTHEYTEKDVTDHLKAIRKAQREAKKSKFAIGDHCQYCRVKHKCPAQREHVGSALDLADKTPVPTDLSESQLAWVLEHGDNLIKYINACREHALQMGGVDGHFKVVEGKSRRKWIDDEEAIKAALAETLLVEDDYLVTTTKLVAFSKVEKLLGKEVFSELNVTETPPGKPTLAPIGDKRPALSEAIGDVLDQNPT